MRGGIDEVNEIGEMKRRDVEQVRKSEGRGIRWSKGNGGNVGGGLEIIVFGAPTITNLLKFVKS